MPEPRHDAQDSPNRMRHSITRLAFAAVFTCVWSAASMAQNSVLTTQFVNARELASNAVSIDVAIELADNDAWVYERLLTQTFAGLRLVYALDPNSAEPLVVRPDRDGDPLTPAERFSSFVSLPRPQTAPDRFRADGEPAIPGASDPSGPVPQATPTLFDVDWRSTTDPGSRPGGYVARVTLLLPDGLDPNDLFFVNVDPGDAALARLESYSTVYSTGRGPAFRKWLVTFCSDDWDGPCVMDCNADGIADITQEFGVFSGAALELHDDNYVAVEHSEALQFDTGDEITIESWIRPTYVNDTRTLVAKGRAANQNYVFRINSGHLAFGYRNTADDAWFIYRTDEQVLFDNEDWRHVAVRHTFGTSDIDIFVNGQTVPGSWGSSPPNSGPLRAAEELTIGAQQRATRRGRMHTLRGTIDELRIWRTLRSDAQIAEDMQRRLAGSEPGLTAYWRFDEGEGGTTADLVAGHDGTLVGTSWRRFAAVTGDLDADNDADLNDLALQLANFGTTDGATRDDGDLDNDGDVDLDDVALMLANFGTACG